MIALTEEEIRAAIEPDFATNGTLHAAGRLSDAFGDMAGALDDLYDNEDRRPSENGRFRRHARRGDQAGPDRAIAEPREAAGRRGPPVRPGASRRATNRQGARRRLTFGHSNDPAAYPSRQRGRSVWGTPPRSRLSRAGGDERRRHPWGPTEPKTAAPDVR